MKKQNIKDLTGLKFAYLKALRSVPTPLGLHKRSLFICDCGKEKILSNHNVISGRTRSCGCLFKKGNHRTHGMASKENYHPLYNRWSLMRDRCSNKNNRCYPRYGGRGIKVCKRWDKFENFLKDMGTPPTPSHSVERINNKGNYGPSNCKWATNKEQSNNRRNNKFVSYQGQYFTVAQLAEKFKLKYHPFADRLRKGWDIERAITQPLKGSS